MKSVKEDKRREVICKDCKHRALDHHTPETDSKGRSGCGNRLCVPRCSRTRKEIMERGN